MNAHTFEHLLRTQLPIAWIAGVRFKSYDGEIFKTCVEHDFLNQNPFGSMFWAVEGMAAEFAGGMMLADKIQKSKSDIAYIVIHSESTFSKKAVGTVIFECKDGKKIDAEIDQAIHSKEGRSFTLKSIGKDSANDIVAEFDFTWSIKVRK